MIQQDFWPVDGVLGYVLGFEFDGQKGTFESYTLWSPAPLWSTAWQSCTCLCSYVVIVRACRYVMHAWDISWMMVCGNTGVGDILLCAMVEEGVFDL